MPTKQIAITLQAEPLTDQDVVVSVSVDGITVFDQAVPAVGTAEQGQTDPNETFQFSLEVPSSAVPGVQNRNFSISATNGRAKIEKISSNFTRVGNGSTLEPGNAGSFVTCNVVSQPLWNGEALLDRYDISYNLGPAQVTGPGEILIEAGETVVFDMAVPLYNPPEWDAETTYEGSSVVSYLGTVYQGFQAGTAIVGQNPTIDTTYWFPLPVAAWDVDLTYAMNDRVVYQDQYYRALQAVPAGTAITDTEYWGG